MMNPSIKMVAQLVFVVLLSLFSLVHPRSDEAITIDTNWEENGNDPNYDTVVIQSPIVTDWGNWGRWANCSMTNSFVTGFQLKVETREAGIDNTAVNGINLSCGIPEQKEVERISSAKGPWGTGRTRMFCSRGPAIGFRLKVQKSQGSGVDDAATVNVKMLCQNGEILEGYDEQGDYYVDTVWSDPMICPDKMGVCGMQTQIEPRQWLGDDTSLNNIRIKCCPMYSSNDGQEDQENPTTDGSVSNSTLFPVITESQMSKSNLKVFQDQNGMGQMETLEILKETCNNLPEKWQNQVGSISKDTPCIRFWAGLSCTGSTRCYCDDNLLSFNEGFTMTNESSWYHQLSAVGPCQLEDNNVVNMHSYALLFSGMNFEGKKSQIILAPGECLNFYEKDYWHGNVNSVIVEKGCIKLFEGEECTGDHAQIESTVLYVGNKWTNRTVAVRNCYDY